MSKLQHRLLRQMTRLNKSFALIEPDDRIMVACSGGKDSWVLLHLLRDYMKKVPFKFSIVAMNLDQGHPGFPEHVLREHFEANDFEYRMEFQDTYSVVKEKVPEGDVTCPLCSRMRRGVLYRVATDLGATKIALGHHRDDVVETLLLNIFFSGQIKAMPPKLCSDNGQHTVIRPLAGSAESDIAAYATELEVPIVPCDLCGSQENLQRKRIKRLLDDLTQEHPYIRESIAASLSNLVPSHLMLPGTGEQPAAASADVPLLRLLGKLDVAQ